MILPLPTLSEQDVTLLSAIAAGRNIKEAAALLGWTEKATHRRLEGIRARWGAQTTMHLMYLYGRRRPADVIDALADEVLTRLQQTLVNRANGVADDCE